MTEPTNVTQRVYRLDRFAVPHSAREEFLALVDRTHEVLRVQPGFVRDLLLEQALSDAAFDLVTLVEWQDAKYIENAGAAVTALHKRIGFNKQETLARLGIKAEFGSYKHVPADQGIARSPGVSEAPP